MSLSKNDGKRWLCSLWICCGWLNFLALSLQVFKLRAQVLVSGEDLPRKHRPGILPFVLPFVPGTQEWTKTVRMKEFWWPRRSLIFYVLMTTLIVKWIVRHSIHLMWQEYRMLMVLHKPLSYPYLDLSFWLSYFNSAASF